MRMRSSVGAREEGRGSTDGCTVRGYGPLLRRKERVVVGKGAMVSVMVQLKIWFKNWALLFPIQMT